MWSEEANAHRVLGWRLFSNALVLHRNSIHSFGEIDCGVRRHSLTGARLQCDSGSCHFDGLYF